MKPHSELAPSSGLDAESLAAFYGYADVTGLAASLPLGAIAADFGTGTSDLGETVSGLRADVRWINVDIRSGSHLQVPPHQTIPHGNLRYVQASVFCPPFKERSLDRVFSSWLLPYIHLDSAELAVAAVHRMAGLLKERGVLQTTSQLMPLKTTIRNNRFSMGANYRAEAENGTYSFTAEEYRNDPQGTVCRTVDAVKLSDHVEESMRNRNALLYGQLILS
jgi:hypothetical protein